MKRNRAFIIILLVLSQSNQLFAQQKKRCGTGEYLARQKAEDPTLEGRLRQVEQMIEREEQQNQLRRTASVNTVITVPVVFHVLYNNAAENISTDRIVDQVAVLNKDYARLNADSDNTPIPFKPLAANIGIQFCLAQRDPGGNPTNGIIRTSVTATGFDPLTNDDAKYTAQGGDDAWPRAQYLNVWVVNFNGLSSTYQLLGITQWPGLAAATDGVVLLYSSVGGNNYPGTIPLFDLGRTLTHEVGHWFGLYHIWGEDGNFNGICDSSTECSGTDYVADTPNQGDTNNGCPAFPKIDCCSSTPTGDPVNGVMFMNYMDFVDDGCMNMFTLGQSIRMHAAINTLRHTINSSNGCLAVTGINEIDSAILDLSVFPNPASGSFTVSSEFIGNTDVVISVSDMAGELVYSRELKNVFYINLPVDLSEKAAGVYHLSLRTTNVLIDKKIIVAH